MKGRGFTTGLVLTTGLLVGFLALPLVALVLRAPPGELLRALANPVALDAVIVTLKTSLVAHLLILVLGTPAAYLLATRRFPGRLVVLGLIDLPLVLPPVVAGIALLSAFGRAGLLGETLEFIGLSISFSQAAVVLAVAFVASPFYVRQAVVAFEAIDPSILQAARTLGAPGRRIFTRIAVPLAAGGLGAGSALAFARGLGEFGATIIFAGSLRGSTQTLPLAIYSELDRNFEVAISISVLLVAVSIAAMAAVRLVPIWLPSTSRSESHVVTSPST
ncbi:MAG TPA: ABC transporter permease [Actinomycetota bacterium]|nr:ABC transporter permease [Actinomycetota bacterium]